jgi:hypothetical protein
MTDLRPEDIKRVILCWRQRHHPELEGQLTRKLADVLKAEKGISPMAPLREVAERLLADEPDLFVG